MYAWRELREEYGILSSNTMLAVETQHFSWFAVQQRMLGIINSSEMMGFLHSITTKNFYSL
jgi:hypothetical protein